MKKPLFVSEVSSNHARDLKRCFKFIEKSAEIGCQAVKFQLFKIDQLFAPEILSKSKRHRDREMWELPTTFLPELALCCQDNNIQFSCTPFYLDAVDELYEYVEFYKIASYEMVWDDLIARCAQTGKPLVLSTGMANLDEIAHACKVFEKNGGKEMTLLHCVSNYPTPVKECNLAALKTLRDQFGYSIGWSDHSVKPSVISRAVHQWGAEFIEFHLDLEGKGEEFSAGHCWLPEEIQPVIQDVFEAFTADGNGEKQPRNDEMVERIWRADPSDGLRPFKQIREEFDG